MPTSRLILVLLIVLECLPLTRPACAANCDGGLAFGVNDGAAVQASLTISEVSRALPILLRTSLGYSRMNPGRPEEARHVFINEATGGTPEKDGRLWTFGADLLWPLAGGSVRRLEGYGGLRYGRFDGHFRYVGDNEEFDVTSGAWGLGAGLEGQAALGPRFALTVSGGIDYFARASLHGHDATYAPDGDNINSRSEYNYADADRAINQPQAEIKLMAGFTCRL